MTQLNATIATTQVFEAYIEAKTLDLQKKTITDMLTVHTTVIKEYMDTKTILFAPDNAAKIATYDYSREPDQIDTKLLKDLFPDVYEAVLKPKTGQLPRRFLLK